MICGCCVVAPVQAAFRCSQVDRVWHLFVTRHCLPAASELIKLFGHLDCTDESSAASEAVVENQGVHRRLLCPTWLSPGWV